MDVIHTLALFYFLLTLPFLAMGGLASVLLVAIFFGGERKE